MTPNPAHTTTTEAAKIAREIRAGLEGVTPGPWSVRSFPNGEWEVVNAGTMIASTFLEGANDPERDAAHLARCSPDRIAILLDAFDAQTQEIAELRERFKQACHAAAFAEGFKDAEAAANSNGRFVAFPHYNIEEIDRAQQWSDGRDVFEMIAELREAMHGIIKEADRDTVAFQRARSALRTKEKSNG